MGTIRAIFGWRCEKRVNLDLALHDADEGGV
jgi:hypothetical protein